MYKIYFRIENLQKVKLSGEVTFLEGQKPARKNMFYEGTPDNHEVFIKEDPTYITRLMDFVPPLNTTIKLEGNYYTVDDVCYRLKEDAEPTVVEIIASPCTWEE